MVVSSVCSVMVVSSVCSVMVVFSVCSLLFRDGGLLCVFIIIPWYGLLCMFIIIWMLFIISKLAIIPRPSCSKRR